MKTILAIETSCDDTSIAVVRGHNVLTLKTHSQIEEHKKFGGVIPELASRYHANDIHDLIEKAMNDTGLDFSDLDGIAVTTSPGLINTLQVGLQVAKTLSQELNIPFYSINHIEAHAFSPFIGKDILPKKAIVVIASGGHTQIFKMDTLFKYKLLGETKDDAIGEAFDKVAKILDLGYPGGPVIDKIHSSHPLSEYKFDTPNLKGYDMSYSGLKSKVLNEKKKTLRDDETLAAAFQGAAVDQLVNKIKLAIKDNPEIENIIVGGGVSANSYFRNELKKIENVNVHLPKSIYTGDNAAMIGYLCNIKLERKKIEPAKIDMDAKPRGGINGK